MQNLINMANFVEDNNLYFSRSQRYPSIPTRPCNEETFFTETFVTNFTPKPLAMVSGRPCPSDLARDSLNEVIGRDKVQSILDSYLRSNVSYDALRDDVLQFGTFFPGDIDVDEKIWNETVQEVLKGFTLPKKSNPIHYNELFDNDELRSKLPLSHSPGLPFSYTYNTPNPIKTKREAMEVIRQEMRTNIHNAKFKGARLKLSPVIVSCRNHMIMNGCSEKIRAIYAYPTDAWMVEVMLYKDLIEKFKQYDNTIYGMKTIPILGGLNKLSSPNWKIALDMKLMDKTAPPFVISTAFWIVEQLIDWTVYADGGIPDSASLLKLHKTMEDYFINTPMQLPTGEIIIKKGGVPSGTHLTNLLDSIIMALISTYTMKILEIPYILEDSRYMGDDGRTVLARHFVPQQDILMKIADVMFKCFGMIVNANKSKLVPPWHEDFLGYELRSPYTLPFRDITPLLASFLIPEGRDKTASDTLMRLIGLSYAGGFNGPFLDICKRLAEIIGTRVEAGESTKRGAYAMLRAYGVPTEYWTKVCTREAFTELVSRGLPLLAIEAKFIYG